MAKVVTTIARRLEARLLLAQVVGSTAISTGDRGSHQVAERARRFFERMALEAGGGEWAQAVVRIGDPRSALEDLARRCGAEVVISGSHGRSIRGVLLGGVSRHLTKRSARAVIVVPPEASRRWEGGEPERGTLNSIVCGVDGSMVGFEAAEAAGQVAAGLGARLTLVHAYLPVPPVGFTTPPHRVLDVGTFTESERRSRLQLLSRAATLAGEQKEVRTVIREDEAVSAIESVAEEQRAGLIIVGSRGRRKLLPAVLGSTSARLTVCATRPVLVVRHGHAARLRRLNAAALPGAPDLTER